MTPAKVLIEITSSEIKTTVLSSDGEPLGEYKWERTGAGSWRGQKNDWEAILNEQSECEGDFDELAEALDRSVPVYVRPQASEPAPKRPPNCGTGHCSCIECVMEPAVKESLTVQAAFNEWWGLQPDDSPTYQATFAAGFNAGLAAAPEAHHE